MTFRAMKAVYCYYFQETRAALKAVTDALPDDAFRVTAPAALVAEKMAGLYDPPLDLTATADGFIDLDEIHRPIVVRILKAYQKTVPGLSKFTFVYPTSGSAEGLFHLLVHFQRRGAAGINVLDGEYEGYAAQGRNIGLKVTETPMEAALEPGKTPGLWFVSNPSARDGQILPDGFIPSLAQAGHRVVADLAYVGATRPHVFDIDHENVRAVVLSFSKPYGLFRFRVGGFCFSREEIPTLYGNKWFKDVTRLFQALKVAEAIGPEGLYPRYRPWQERIVADLNRDWGLGLTPSDSLLLARLSHSDAGRLDPAQQTLIAPFRRGPGYRFCLTPYFEEMERRGGRGEVSVGPDA